MERRLAAVLAADVVGYSRLMGIDEEGRLFGSLRPGPHQGRVFSSGPQIGRSILRGENIGAGHRQGRCSYGMDAA